MKEMHPLVASKQTSCVLSAENSYSACEFSLPRFQISPDSKSSIQFRKHQGVIRGVAPYLADARSESTVHNLPGQQDLARVRQVGGKWGTLVVLKINEPECWNRFGTILENNAGSS